MGLTWKPTPPADAPVPFANGCHAGELNLGTRITESYKKSCWTVFAPRQAGQACDDIVVHHQEALFLIRPIVPSVAKLE